MGDISQLAQVADTTKTRQQSWNSIGTIGRYTLVAVVVMIALNCAMVLSLRVFPDHDGPMFSYIAHVAQDLLSGGKEYGRYFALRAVVTPYAFNIYALMTLNRIFDPVTSEKLFVCLVVALLLGGAYALSRSVSPRFGAAGLLVCPFALHKLIFLGFQNFPAAAGIAIFLCAFWCAHYRRWKWWKTVIFSAALALLAITHPTGTLITGLFLAIHAFVLVVQYFANTSGPWTTRFGGALLQIRLHALHLLLCVPPIIFIVHSTPVGTGDSLILSVSYWVQQLRKFALFGPLSAFQVWYYAAPQAISVVAAAALLWTSLRKREWTTPGAVNALACLLAAIAFTLLYMVSPGEVAGGAYFDQKFPILVLVFFFAAAARNEMAEKWHWVMGSAVCAVSLFLLGYQTIQCRRMNVEMADVLDAPTVPRGNVGALTFEGPIMTSHRPFSPMVYGGAYYFIRSHAVMINVPYWIDHPYVLIYPIDPANSTPAAPPPIARGIRLQNTEAVIPWLLKGDPQQLDFLLEGQIRPNSGTGETGLIAERRGLIPAQWKGGYFHLFVAPSVH
jgi:hypothetical protein